MEGSEITDKELAVLFHWGQKIGMQSEARDLRRQKGGTQQDSGLSDFRRPFKLSRRGRVLQAESLERVRAPCVAFVAADGTVGT